MWPKNNEYIGVYWILIINNHTSLISVKIDTISSTYNCDSTINRFYFMIKMISKWLKWLYFPIVEISWRYKSTNVFLIDQILSNYNYSDSCSTVRCTYGTCKQWYLCNHRSYILKSQSKYVKAGRKAMQQHKYTWQPAKLIHVC